MRSERRNNSTDRPAWPTSALRDLVDSRGITYGVVQPGGAQPDGVPIVRVNNFTATGLELGEVLRIDPEIAARHERSRLAGGEVLITLVGSVGQVAVVPAALDGWNVARAVGVIPVRRDVSSRWVAWCLRTPEAMRYLDARLNTTVQRTMNLRDLASLRIPLPPDGAVRIISSVLGVLDDKLDSNRQMARTLQALVSETFNWRFATPAGLGVQSVKGVLGDLVQQHREGCRASGATASLPYVPIDAISSHSLMLEDKRPGEQAMSSLTMFEASDILFGAMRPYFHKVAIAPFRGVTRTTVFVLRPINDLDWAYVALLLNQPDTIDFATRTARGSTIPYAVWDGVLSKMPIDIPSADERTAFGIVALPALRFIQNACFELNALTEIRDALLPKLISGEISVPDTHDPEEVIGPAAERLAAATP